MVGEDHIQAISRFIVGFGTEQDNIWRDYNLDFAGKITYDGNGNPVAFAPVGNSGYSLGSLQWDFGQGALLAGPFVESFEAWFAKNPKATPLKSDPEFATRAVALQGKILTAKPALGLKRQDVTALSEFVRSDGGSDWVNINIDQNLIGSDAQPRIKWKTEEMTQVAVARKVEATAAFKTYAGKNDSDTTDLIYAIGMKTYNQAPSRFTKSLLPFLAKSPSPEEIGTWYQQWKKTSPGLYSGVKAATELSQFWSKWRRANAGPLCTQMTQEMLSQSPSNPVAVSATRGAYVVVKQIFENTDRFEQFAAAKANGVDYVASDLFDPKTGAISINPKTGRLRPGLLVKNKIAYAWNAAGNSYSAIADTWNPIQVSKINIKKL